MAARLSSSQYRVPVKASRASSTFYPAETSFYTAAQQQQAPLCVPVHVAVEEDFYY